MQCLVAGIDYFRGAFQPKWFYKPNHCIGIESAWNCTLLEPGVWAQQNGNKWQTVTAATCAVQKQQGFICECNTLKTQDICLDTEHNVCHFEIHPRETSETVLGCVGNGCVCMRALCDSLEIESIHSPSNTCIYNFIKVMGCSFNYSATTHHVTARLKKGGKHLWWQNLLRWSPTAARAMNSI